MYVVTVSFDVKPESVDAFRIAMLEQAANSIEKEAGCHQFDVCFDPKQPHRCFLYEKYTDRTAFDLHLASDHFKDFNETVGPMLANKEVDHWDEATGG